MKIGLDAYTIEPRGLSVDVILDLAAGHGLDGVQFLEPRRLAADLDPARLREVRAQADALGLAIEVGLPSPNPFRRSRADGRTVLTDVLIADLIKQIEAIAILGCRHSRVYFGDRHDRFRTDIHWTEQVAATKAVIARLAPTLRDHGIALAIETHADLTCCELLAILDAFEPDIVGVTLDTGNLAMRLDDPIAAAESLAPRVLATHLKDVVLAFTPRGLCWQARPIGSGILPMTDLLAILQRANPNVLLSIELHPRTYDLPIFDPAWLAHFPDLPPASLAAVVKLAVACERRFAEGSLARPEVVEAIPWADRDIEWLASSVGYLKPVVAMLGRVGDQGAR
jgi:sugar phosphate isomerase/epimerase